MKGVHRNIGVQKDSKTLLLKIVSISCGLACEFRFKVSKSANRAQKLFFKCEPNRWEKCDNVASKKVPDENSWA